MRAARLKEGPAVMPSQLYSPAKRILSSGLAALFLSFAWKAPQSLGPQFTDITRQAGITFKHGSGAPEKNYIFEAKGGGVALLDYDNDGFLDMYFVNGSTLEDLDKGVVHSNALYHANGDGTYTDLPGGSPGKRLGMGVAVGDYNNDSYPDIYVLAEGEHIYRNNGDGHSPMQPCRPVSSTPLSASAFPRL
jgi:hypothetical protein